MDGNGEFQTFPLVKVWNHPIETTIKIWLFRVPGVNHPTDHLNAEASDKQPSLQARQDIATQPSGSGSNGQ